jgi:hypothetical protein
MSQPSLTFSETDGALGVLPAGAKPLAIIGPAATGTANTPAAYARKQDVITLGTRGPAVEAACKHIGERNRPIVLTLTGATVDGTYPAGSTTVQTGTGTSVITVDDVGTAPDDDYEVYLLVVTGGTIGVAGITFQYSLDGGRTMSPPVALGVDTEYVIPGTGGVEIEFAAGTLVAGDTCSFWCVAPCWNTAELTAALTALQNYAGAWEQLWIVGNLDAAAIDAVETAFTAMMAAGKERSWMGNVRMPTSGESEANYATAVDAIVSAKTTTHGSVIGGACEFPSGVDGKLLRRPFAWEVASLHGVLSEEEDAANPTDRFKLNCTIADTLGNPKHHDESVNPTLDDLRVTCARTWEDFPGVYTNRPRLLSSPSSDYQLIPHRRVMNLAKTALRAFMARRLSKPVAVDLTTGYILEIEALEIEAGAHKAVSAVLDTKPKASGGGFTGGQYVQISRTDDLLSTRTMTGTLRVVPLAYPEYIEIGAEFYNPAMQLVTT